MAEVILHISSVRCLKPLKQIDKSHNLDVSSFKENDAVIPDATKVVIQGPHSQLFAHQETRQGSLVAPPAPPAPRHVRLKTQDQNKYFFDVSLLARLAFSEIFSFFSLSYIFGGFYNLVGESLTFLKD